MAKKITFIAGRQNNEIAETAIVINKTRVAAYCRVSTDQEEQLSSYEAQVRYYTNYIQNNNLYEFAGIYADEGITATNTKKRDEFKRMIKDCREGKIDRIITKSISRFARNTVDCLNYVRELKELGIGITFEKENIDTLDAKGEVLLTILSSLAQEESRSISENSTWGIMRRFEEGKVALNHNRFLGYDKDEEGNLIINEKQAKIVRRIYSEFLNRKGINHIARELERDKIKSCSGNTKWYDSTVKSILQNEKYKGDALLQKTYTVDFLSKKREVNNGEVPQYYVEESHPAIIEPETWEAVQLEIERRKVFCEEHNIKKLDTSIPFLGKVICGECGATYSRKTWMQPDGTKRKVWMCSNRYKIKGIKGCESKHIDEEVLKKAFVEVFNALVENKQYFLEKWQQELKGDEALKKYRLKGFIEMLEKEEEQQNQFDESLCLKLLEQIKVLDGQKQLIVTLLDGSSMEYKISIKYTKNKIIK